VKGATNMAQLPVELQMVDFDPNDGVRLGLTSLPNAAADAAGGLPISDAGGLDLDAKLANTNEVTAARMGALTDWINGGRLDLLLDAIKVATDKIDSAHTEPTGVPAANETPLDKLAYVFMALRNQLDITASKKQFYDDGGAVEWEKDLSDDGTTYSETEGNAP